MRESIDQLVTDARAAVREKPLLYRTESLARLEWIQAHGSARLVRCAEEGIEHDGILRDEWLALERPGWTWNFAGADWNKPRNPPEAVFAVLDEARKSEPGAEVFYVQGTEEQGAHYVVGLYLSPLGCLAVSATFGEPIFREVSA